MSLTGQRRTDKGEIMIYTMAKRKIINEVATYLCYKIEKRITKLQDNR